MTKISEFISPSSGSSGKNSKVEWCPHPLKEDALAAILMPPPESLPLPSTKKWSDAFKPLKLHSEKGQSLNSMIKIESSINLPSNKATRDEGDPKIPRFSGQSEVISPYERQAATLNAVDSNRKEDDMLFDFLNEIDSLYKISEESNEQRTDVGSDEKVGCSLHYAAKGRAKSSNLAVDSVWKEVLDPVSQQLYYWNVESNEVTWNLPEDAKPHAVNKKSEKKVKKAFSDEETPHQKGFEEGKDNIISSGKVSSPTMSSASSIHSSRLESSSAKPGSTRGTAKSSHSNLWINQADVGDLSATSDSTIYPFTEFQEEKKKVLEEVDFGSREAQEGKTTSDALGKPSHTLKHGEPLRMSKVDKKIDNFLRQLEEIRDAFEVEEEVEVDDTSLAKKLPNSPFLVIPGEELEGRNYTKKDDEVEEDILVLGPLDTDARAEHVESLSKRREKSIQSINRGVSEDVKKEGDEGGERGLQSSRGKYDEHTESQVKKRGSFKGALISGESIKVGEAGEFKDDLLQDILEVEMNGCLPPEYFKESSFSSSKETQSIDSSCNNIGNDIHNEAGAQIQNLVSIILQQLDFSFDNEQSMKLFLKAQVMTRTTDWMAGMLNGEYLLEKLMDTYAFLQSSSAQFASDSPNAAYDTQNLSSFNKLLPTSESANDTFLPQSEPPPLPTDGSPSSSFFKTKPVCGGIHHEVNHEVEDYKLPISSWKEEKNVFNISSGFPLEGLSSKYPQNQLVEGGSEGIENSRADSGVFADFSEAVPVGEPTADGHEVMFVSSPSSDVSSGANVLTNYRDTDRAGGYFLHESELGGGVLETVKYTQAAHSTALSSTGGEQYNGGSLGTGKSGVSNLGASVKRKKKVLQGGSLMHRKKLQLVDQWKKSAEVAEMEEQQPFTDIAHEEKILREQKKIEKWKEEQIMRSIKAAEFSSCLCTHTVA